MNGFTELETAVLNWMAENINVPHLAEQIRASTATAREYTNIGFFISLFVPLDVPAIEAKSPITGPTIMSPGIEYDGGTLIFLDKGGRIMTLELYAYGNRFDEKVTDFTLKAYDGIDLSETYIASNNGVQAIGDKSPQPDP